MITSSSVVAIAFYFGLGCVLFPICKFVGGVLEARKRTVRDWLANLGDVKNVGSGFVRMILSNRMSVESEAERIVKTARAEVELILSAHKNEIQEYIEGRIDSTMQVISEKIDDALSEIRLRSVNVARDVTKKVAKEQLSESVELQRAVCRVAARDLSKKLH